MTLDAIDNPADLYPRPHWQFVLVLLFNTGVALVLTAAMGDWGAFRQMWIFSQCIGIAILCFTHVMAWIAGRWPQPRDMLVGIVIGSIIGNVIATITVGSIHIFLQQGWLIFGANFFLGVLFGAFAGNLFFSTLRVTKGERALKQQALQRVMAEKQLIETQLRLLQAQIEPRFLFNTLSAIHGLIDLSPQKSSRMLEALTRFLRASLDRTRDGVITLGDEVVLIRSYLEIQQERLSGRLCYKIDVAADLLPMPLSPLLIQPLIEEAVQSRIEPSRQGGTVSLCARSEQGIVVIEVEERGDRAIMGDESLIIALRERLHSLYGNAGSLSVELREADARLARITLPHTESTAT